MNFPQKRLLLTFNHDYFLFVKFNWVKGQKKSFQELIYF